MLKRRFTFFDFVIYFIMTSFAAITIYPFLNVLSVSISTFGSFLANPMMVIPTQIDFMAYKELLSTPLVLSCYKNTIIITITGTLLSMLLTITTAFPLSRPHFRAKPFFVYMIVFTMLFNGGLIPHFYLVSSLGMYDSLLALIIPGSLSAFNVILLINFFKSIPDSLLESAKIDGATDFQVLVKIMVPLSLAIIATLSLFYAVARWNTFFAAVIYIRDRDKWTLQLFLREMMAAANAAIREDEGMLNYVPPQTLRYASIMVSVIPILVVYPFVQKYFIKGVMLGAVKE